MSLLDLEHEITDELLIQEKWDPKVIVKSRGTCWVKTMVISHKVKSRFSDNYYTTQSWDRFLFEPDKMRVTYLNIAENDTWIGCQVSDYQDILVFIDAILLRFGHTRVK